MKITVCQLPDDPVLFADAWRALADHVATERSELVVLPELPFHRWFGASREFSAATWAGIVAAHEQGCARLPELGAPHVAATRATSTGGTRHNVGFLWSRPTGVVDVHTKHYLPEEEGFYEASWYQPGPPEFSVGRAGAATLGFMICSELWAMDLARHYSRAGAQVLATPRATGAASGEKWLLGGRTAAIVAGAYSVSSNRYSANGDFGGGGWIVDPDGTVLATTSARRPFATGACDLARADDAKRTYPRYVLLR